MQKALQYFNVESISVRIPPRFILSLDRLTRVYRSLEVWYNSIQFVGFSVNVVILRRFQHSFSVNVVILRRFQHSFFFGVSKNMIAVRTAKAEGSDAACRPHFAHFQLISFVMCFSDSFTLTTQEQLNEILGNFIFVDITEVCRQTSVTSVTSSVNIRPKSVKAREMSGMRTFLELYSYATFVLNNQQ